MFPADNVWNADVSHLPVHPMSSQYVSSIGSTAQAKADFGAGLWDGGPIGIPYNVVGAGQPTTSVTFDFDEDSDHVPYPIPANPAIEGGPSSNGDRHILIVDNSSCTLYELYAAYPNGNGTWHAGSGAVWNLNSNALRTDTYTSADAAGLPILPGLVRYDEVASGHIDHAIRVTVPASDKKHLWPARHDAGTANSNLPPMGLRLRLKAQVDIASYPHDDQVILQAMKTYGVIVADNGSPWYMTGVPDERWDNDVLQQLRNVRGSDFEAVDESSLMLSSSSGAVRNGPPPPPPPPPVLLPLGDGPAATTPSPGTEDVYVRGTDDALWTRQLNNGMWGPWVSLGGAITSAPAASGSDVYARGTDNALWTRHGPSPWVSLGGVITSAPAATPTDLYVRGTDNALWNRHLNNGMWGPWVSLGGAITSAPAASGNDVYARGTDNALWTRHGPSPWVSLGGVITSAPATNGSDVYARGTDNALWTRRAPSPWVTLGGQITSPPSVTGSDVFVRGTDYALWTRRAPSPWVSLGGQIR
ncbi:MAG: hypothetical protein QOI95_3794 [Acidimicrobiaceae bacterium]|jgi:hypothetical protein